MAGKDTILMVDGYADRLRSNQSESVHAFHTNGDNDLKSLTFCTSSKWLETREPKKFFRPILTIHSDCCTQPLRQVLGTNCNKFVTLQSYTLHKGKLRFLVGHVTVSTITPSFGGCRRDWLLCRRCASTWAYPTGRVATHSQHGKELFGHSLCPGHGKTRSNSVVRTDL